MWINLGLAQKSKIPKKKMKQIEMYVDEIDDNRKQFASELNELPMNEDNQDNIMLQDIITKNEINSYRQFYKVD